MNRPRYKEMFLEEQRRRVILLERLIEIETAAETPEENNGPLAVVKAEGEWYGSYVTVSGAPEAYEGILDKLAAEIAKGLLENHIAQIIVKEADGSDSGTIGAKLFVIPWERLREEKKGGDPA